MVLEALDNEGAPKRFQEFPEPIVRGAVAEFSKHFPGFIHNIFELAVTVAHIPVSVLLIICIDAGCLVIMLAINLHLLFDSAFGFAPFIYDVPWCCNCR